MAKVLIRLLTLGVAAIMVAGLIFGLLTLLDDGEREGVVFAQGAQSYAALERDHPFTPADRNGLTVERLSAMTPEELDQIYARLTAGPAPDGIYESTFLGDAAAALHGMSDALPGPTAEFVEQIAALAWRARSIDREAGRAISVSRDFDPVQVMINRLSAIDGVRPEYRGFPVEDVPRGGILGLVFSTTSAYAMFPARLYCGASLADPRRESHLIDHRRNDTIDGYRPIPDVAAGSRGLALREEYRRVRPGLYLGRVYAAGVPLGHAVLRQAEAKAGADTEPCWPGEPALASE